MSMAIMALTTKLTLTTLIGLLLKMDGLLPMLMFEEAIKKEKNGINLPSKVKSTKIGLILKIVLPT